MAHPQLTSSPIYQHQTQRSYHHGVFTFNGAISSCKAIRTPWRSISRRITFSLKYLRVKSGFNTPDYLPYPFSPSIVGCKLSAQLAPSAIGITEISAAFFRPHTLPYPEGPADAKDRALVDTCGTYIISYKSFSAIHVTCSEILIFAVNLTWSCCCLSLFCNPWTCFWLFAEGMERCRRPSCFSSNAAGRRPKHFQVPRWWWPCSPWQGQNSKWFLRFAGLPGPEGFRGDFGEYSSYIFPGQRRKRSTPQLVQLHPTTVSPAPFAKHSCAWPTTHTNTQTHRHTDTQTHTHTQTAFDGPPFHSLHHQFSASWTDSNSSSVSLCSVISCKCSTW